MTQLVCKNTGTKTEEALIRSLYDCLPDEGATLLLLDRTGNIRSGYPQTDLSLENIRDDICPTMVIRLDDGDDPVMKSTNDCTLVATELPRSLGPWSYAMVVLPQCTLDHALQRFDLIQMILGQIGMICCQV